MAESVRFVLRGGLYKTNVNVSDMDMTFKDALEEAKVVAQERDPETALSQMEAHKQDHEQKKKVANPILGL